MASFALLDQVDEDKLHATRLLSVEEKPFKRLTKRLLSSASPIQSFSSRLPTPPTDSPSSNLTRDQETAADHHEKYLANLIAFRTNLHHDFAAFNASIARIQFLRSANEKERLRYSAEKEKILSTAQEVRDSTSHLRVQLDEAQRTLAVRKTYDVLAEKITRDERLKPRSEQSVAVERLRVEIEDLEREGRELEQSWVDRRDVFGRLVNEGQRVKRLIRGEPLDEEEKVEGDGDGDGDGDDGGSEADGEDAMLDVEGHDQGRQSRGITPAPLEDAPTPQSLSGHDSGSMTSSRVALATPQPDEVDSAMTEGEIGGFGTPRPSRSKLNVVEVVGKAEDQMDIS